MGLEGNGTGLLLDLGWPGTWSGTGLVEIERSRGALNDLAHLAMYWFKGHLGVVRGLEWYGVTFGLGMARDLECGCGMVRGYFLSKVTVRSYSR